MFPRPPHSSDRVKIYFTRIDESDKAIRVTNGRRKVWLAKSVISVLPLRGPDDPNMLVSLPLWLARKTGVI